jgi:glycosyltransferase involved in cell wall biosynthesis
MLNERNFCIFVPSFNTEKYIVDTIERIPWGEMPKDLRYRVVFVDNQSTDSTWEKIKECRSGLDELGIQSDAIRNPRNLGYGGSVKVILDYCVEQDFGLMGVLHSDGQYLPEELPRMVAEFVAEPSYVLYYGSRLTGKPLEGGMPMHKFLANHVLTWIQNRALGSRYSEFHSGYKFYRVDKVRELPYHANSNYFDFDNHIHFQVHHRGWEIGETVIPTYYGEEESNVSPIRTPLKILLNVCSYALHTLGLRRVERYDFSENGMATGSELEKK